jgi:hypothetical protein
MNQLWRIVHFLFGLCCNITPVLGQGKLPLPFGPLSPLFAPDLSGLGSLITYLSRPEPTDSLQQPRQSTNPWATPPSQTGGFSPSPYPPRPQSSRQPPPKAIPSPTRPLGFSPPGPLSTGGLIPPPQFGSSSPPGPYRREFTIRASTHDRDDVSDDFEFALREASNVGGNLRLLRGRKYVIGNRLDLTNLHNVHLIVEGELVVGIRNLSPDFHFLSDSGLVHK